MTFRSKLLLGTALALLFSGSVAMAADLYVPPAAAPVAPAATNNWDGPYIGASLGYGWGTADAIFNGAVFDTAKPNGFLFGGQVGDNFHLSDKIVLGLEGNLDWASQSASFANNTGNNIRLNWEGSVRARLGMDAGTFLPYIEAGVAFANADVTANTNSNNTYTGWTAGAGIEFAVTDKLTTNVEYRYSDYGTQNIDTNGNSLHLTDSTVRVGLNYHF